MIYLFLGNALAATVTDAPGAKQANFSISSSLRSQSATLSEMGEAVGHRMDLHHQGWLSTEYGVIDQISVSVRLPHYVDSLAFSDVHQMEFDPTKRTGTFINSSEIDDFDRTGSGFGGLWVGMYAYPFHPRFHSDRNDRGAWKIGLGYQFADSTPFQTTNEQGDRGAGYGSGALTISGAFSTQGAFGEPYLTLDSRLSGIWSGEIRNEAGEQIKSQVDLRPPSILDCRFGNEITVWKDTAYGSFVAMDVFGRLYHKSHQDVPTNLYMPSVLHAYKDYIVKQGELTTTSAGLGLNMQFNTMYHFGLTGEIGRSSNQYLEHLYQVDLEPALTWGIDLHFTYRLRNSAI